MDREAFVKEVQELLKKHEVDKTGQALVFYSGDDGTTGYTGFGCPMCVVQVILQAVAEGRITHIGTEEENRNAVKH